MRKIILLLVVSFCFWGGVAQVNAQNPKQTKKYKKKNKKKKKPSEEEVPYTPLVEVDSDKDGVPDKWDHCKNSPTGQYVTETGCPPDTDKA